MRTIITALLLTGLGAIVVANPVEAGCGCDKPPPVPAELRPRATYAGAEVTVFHPDLVPGQSYVAEFVSGTTAQSASVQAVAASRRDLADGLFKSQLVVSLPDLPLGPTSITVGDQAGTLLSLGDEALTVVGQPVVVPSKKGEYRTPDFQAAVSRDGVVYVALDLSQLTDPMVFRAQAVGYPLRFAGDETLFYNRQGFLMQQVDLAMPGLFSVAASTDSENSDVLQYSRHEFNTFYLQHEERQDHEVDATDPNWHLDGSPHIDHDHLVLAIGALLPDGSVPEAGATPAFDLVVSLFSLFQHGLVGEAIVSMDDNAGTYSYSSIDRRAPSGEGDVLSNGLVVMRKGSTIEGDARAFDFDVSRRTTITGAQIVETRPTNFMPVNLPTNLEDAGNVTISGTERVTFVGPASYLLSDLTVSESSTLAIDNSAGPVTLYVTGAVSFTGNGYLEIADVTPEKFAIYVTGTGPVSFASNSLFYGVVYAPGAQIMISGNASMYGAFVGQELTMTDRAWVAYDLALRGSPAAIEVAPPTEDTTATSSTSAVNAPRRTKKSR